ncbi:DUF983 domain-containing protein [Paenibacillus sp. NEAU-GSW1]|uniref:DUF983 domain-containing protein n=1 Tax=Paenibacillus sp. NEAU-GSW1 TaxID=2682486 RepID=UPI0012E2ABC4|nr:DUF983 domain-containing protein [Paenibacillus sp. NEAU-GSW1]
MAYRKKGICPRCGNKISFWILYRLRATPKYRCKNCGSNFKWNKYHSIPRFITSILVLVYGYFLNLVVDIKHEEPLLLWWAVVSYLLLVIVLYFVLPLFFPNPIEVETKKQSQNKN